jgi:ABC-type branched-subunit amino acid transport system ATPase component
VAEVALQTDGLTVAFGALRALNDVSLTVHTGAFQGVVGPNGAGKSTLFNAITGFQRPTTGRVRFGAQDITGQRPYRVARLGLRRTFQATRPLNELTVLENVMAGGYLSGRTGFWDSLLSTPRVRREERELAESAMAALRRVAITDLADAYPTELTAGQLRLLEIARALVSGATCLLLDEPAAGLSHAETQRLAGALRELNDSGLTIVLIEHDVDLVLGLCDRVAVLDFGVLIADGQPEQIRRDPAVREAYLGMDSAEALAGAETTTGEAQ